MKSEPKETTGIKKARADSFGEPALAIESEYCTESTFIYYAFYNYSTVEV